MSRMYFKSRETPGAPVSVNGLPSVKPTKDGSVDSNELISSAGNKKKKNSNKSTSFDSVASFDSKESFWSTDMDYI